MVSNIGNVVKLRNTNLAQTGTTPINFRANFTNTLERTPEKDPVETKQEEKKGLSKLAKWGIGIMGLLTAAGTTVLLVSKHQLGKVRQLFKDKLMISNLPEKIEFKEAKTLEEGIKFTREILGIKEIKGFSEFEPKGALEAINFANKGIVDVANANKGKVFLPRVLSLEKMENISTTAYANLAIESNKFGQLGINSAHFTHEGLDSILKRRYGLIKETAQGAKNTELKRKIKFQVKWDKKYTELCEKYIKDPTSLTLAEKRELNQIYNTTNDKWANLTQYNPLTILENNTELFKKEGFTFDLEALSKLSLDEQCSKFDELCSEFLNKTNKILVMDSSPARPLNTIYHEMGHLQDYAKNLEKMHIQNSRWTQFINSFKSSTSLKEIDKYADTNHINNRWAKRGDYKKEIKDNSAELKKYLPDLYEHLNNPEFQKTAGKVSSYAREGVGEFVADVYADLIAGRKFSDDVINLYKKYNGPLLPGM